MLHLLVISSAALAAVRLCACFVCVEGHMKGSSVFTFISSRPVALPKETMLHKVTLSSVEEISSSVLAVDKL